METLYHQRRAHENEIEESLRHSVPEPSVRGYSYPARREVDFTVSIGDAPCNWRESLFCPVTALFNRVRGALHIFDLECAPYDESRIYIMEQTTSVYNFLRERFVNLVGSEYVRDGIPSGTVVDGIRHEDATHLSFDDESFDHVLHFDVFEHVPDYRRAFDECFRVLRSGGNLLWSVPFVLGNEHNTVRAVIRDDGTVENLLEPEYHGDPMRSEGALCFYYFGWEMLSEVRRSGFKDVYAVVFWSRGMGYLGAESILFVACK